MCSLLCFFKGLEGIKDKLDYMPDTFWQAGAQPASTTDVYGGTCLLKHSFTLTLWGSKARWGKELPVYHFLPAERGPGWAFALFLWWHMP